MTIEMGFEPLGIRRRKVDVRLKMAAERFLDGTAQSASDGIAHALRERDRGARTEHW